MCIGSYADISVHAPTRGATSNSLSFSIFSVFQSTLPREERLLGLNFKEANSIFQSTLPREERRAKRTCLPKEPSDFNPRSHERSDTTCDRLARGSYDFNPRSHERSDYIPHDKMALSSISIHAPTRGATTKRKLFTMLIVFQSTLPREERQQYCTKNLFIFIQYRQ